MIQRLLVSVWWNNNDLILSLFIDSTDKCLRKFYSLLVVLNATCEVSMHIICKPIEL